MNKALVTRMELKMDDKALKGLIEDELDWEPRVNAANIGVAVKDGVVTLMGHVPSYVEKIAAEEATRRVKGVRAIAQEIEVRLDGRGAPLKDDQIAEKSANVLDWDVSVPHRKVQARVQNGWVTLTGEVDWNFQREAAQRCVSNLPGVRGVSNSIAVKERATPSDIKDRIEKALIRHAETEAKGIRVSVTNGKVTLEGKIDAWHDREVAEKVAWAAPGVTAVEDRLQIA